MSQNTRTIVVLDCSRSKKEDPVMSLEGDFLGALAQAYSLVRQEKLNLVKKRVYSRKSLRNQLCYAREHKAVGVHLIGHADKNDAQITRTGFVAGKDIDANYIDFSKSDDRDLFRGLFEGVPESWMLISSCYTGRDKKSLRDIRKISGAEAVFAYWGDDEGIIREYQAFILDAIFYHWVLGVKSTTWSLIRRRFGEATKLLVTGANVGSSFLR